MILIRTVLAALCTVSTIASATLELSQTATYYVPGLTGIIQQTKFNDGNADGAPEMLVSDGNKIALYAPADNAILFESPINAGVKNHAVMYEDIDRDQVPDILIGYYFENGAFSLDTVCRVTTYDGASNYLSAESLYFEADIDFTVDTQSPSSFVAFSSYDISGDGYRDLFFSFDRCRLTPFIDNHIQVTAGQTSLYSSFPDAEDFSRKALLRDIQSLETSGGRLLMGTRYDNFAIIPGESKTAAWVEIISDSGDSLGSIGQPPVSLCWGDSVSLISTIELLCVGDIHTGSDDPDVLVKYHWHQTCYKDDALSFDESRTSLRLYRVGAPDDIELLWSDLTPAITANFYYSPDFPGSFFGASGGAISRFSGIDGGEVDQSESIDADTIIWRPGANLSDGDFVAVKNQTLTVYRLGISTDVPDNGHVISPPQQFTLSNPHPNPFNSSCVIEYSLPHRARTAITIYNILGQEITTLVDETKPAGDHTVYWNGTDESGKTVASGIYLYTMTAGEFVASRKLVLMK